MKLSRRTALKGALGGAAVSVGLPWLEAMTGASPAAHASGAFPRRFVLFFWGNGNIPDRWNPVGEGTAWTLSEQLEPLAPMKSKLSVVSGLSIKTGNTIPHFSGASGILSGAPLIVRSRDDSTFRAPSIDQVIAGEVGGSTRFRSIELGVVPRRGLSFNGPDNQNPPEASPARAFERLFGGGFVLPGEGGGEVDPRLRLRRSVLDAVLAQARGLERRLGAEDRRRLDQHLTGIRELEGRIARLSESPPDLEGCARPDAPPAELPEVEGRLPLDAIAATMGQLLAYALACDQTRVASLWFSYPVHNLLYPTISSGHHQLTHDEPGDQPQVHFIVRYIMTQLNAFLQTLDGIQEGPGTLLDHSAVLATSDVSLGRSHSLDDMPVMVAGSCGGRLRPGLHYRSGTAENASRVLLTLCRAMGLRLEAFGEDEGRVADGLGALEA